MISDGFHQSLKPNEFFSEIFKLKKNKNIKNWIFIDRSITWNDFFKSIIYFIQIKKKFKSFINDKHVLNGINLSEQIKEELILSFHQIPRIILFFNAYKKIFKINKPKEVIYYLHEFVAGRFLSYILNTYYTEINSKGFQHGPIAQRKMLYALSLEETNGKNYLFNVPLPKKNLCEDYMSKSIYRSYGYKNLIVQSNIQRLKYLEKIKRENIQSKTCLLAGGLHDSINLIEYASQNKIYEHKKVWLKLHPMVEKKVINRS